MKQGRRINKWTRGEDTILIERFRRQQAENPSGGVIDWQDIASALPGRSNKDCRKRWYNVLSEDLRKGVWVAEEDEKLIKAVALEGKIWTRVAAHVPKRTADQCAKRWQHFLDPVLDWSEWTEDENQMLLQAVQKHGRRWLDIRNQFFQSRSPNALKNQYSMISRRYRKSNGSPPGDLTTAPDSPNLSDMAGTNTDNKQPMANSDSKPLACDIGTDAPLLNEDILMSGSGENNPCGSDNMFSLPSDDLMLADYDFSMFDFPFDVDLPNTNPHMPLEDFSTSLPLTGGSPVSNAEQQTAATSANSELTGNNTAAPGQMNTDELATDSNSSFSVTMTLNNPTTETMNNVIQILMTHRQQVKIDINQSVRPAV